MYSTNITGRAENARPVLICFLLSLAGLFLAGYLSFIHLALLRGELVGGPLCGGAGSFLNCHAVAASRYSKLFGIPIAFWGVLGYLLLLTFSLIAWRLPGYSRQGLAAVAGLAGAFFLLDLGLLWVMVVKIGAVCLLCVAMYLIKGLLFVAAVFGLGPPRRGGLFGELAGAWRAFLPRRGSAAGLLVWMTAALGLAGLVTVHVTADYFARAPEGLRARIIERMRTAPRVKVDPGDSPRIGSPQAPVQVVMFTDPLCPLCREAEEFNAIALKIHPREISLVTKQFSLDPQALEACLAAGLEKANVMKDLKEGKRLGVAATPTFFVNGVKILGEITPAQFDEIVRVEENRGSNTIPGEKR